LHSLAVPALLTLVLHKVSQAGRQAAARRTVCVQYSLARRSRRIMSGLLLLPYDQHFRTALLRRSDTRASCANSQMKRTTTGRRWRLKASAPNWSSIRREQVHAREAIPVLVGQLLHNPGQCTHGCGCAATRHSRNSRGRNGARGRPLAPRWPPTDASARSLDDWRCPLISGVASLSSPQDPELSARASSRQLGR
jgi:hypothetical protein